MTIFVETLPRTFSVQEDDPIKITRTVIVFDAADIDAVSAPWADLLDGTLKKDEGWHSIMVDG